MKPHITLFVFILILIGGLSAQNNDVPARSKEITVRVDPELCVPQPGDLGQMNQAFTDPNPLTIPGKFSLNFNFTINQDLMEPMDMKIEVLKKVPLMFGMVTWISMPCIRTPELAFGGCFLKDLCKSNYYNTEFCLKEGTKDQFYECGCPTFKKGTYFIKPLEYNFGEIPADIPDYILEGEVIVRLDWLSGGKRISCLEVPTKVKATKNKD